MDEANVSGYPEENESVDHWLLRDVKLRCTAGVEASSGRRFRARTNAPNFSRNALVTVRSYLLQSLTEHLTHEQDSTRCVALLKQVKRERRLNTVVFFVTSM